MHAVIVALLASLPAPDALPDINPSDVAFFQLYDRERVKLCRMAALNFLDAANYHYPITQQDEEFLAAWKRDARYCYECWDTLDDIQIYSGMSAEIVVRKLTRLRELLGEPAYYSAEMPPPIPHWRLPRID